MISFETAKRIVHGNTLSARGQLAVVAAINPAAPLRTEQIKNRCVKIGLRRLAKKNISDVMGKATGYFARPADGWELQEAGIAYVRNLMSAEEVDAASLAPNGASQAPLSPTNVDDVLRLLTAFPDCVGYSQNRRAAPIFPLMNESNVQDLLYFMLRPAIGDLAPEHPVANVTRQYSLKDYLCRNIATAVEVKFVRSRQHGKALKKELHDDIGEYKADPACEHLIFFIYDPGKHIESPTALKKSVEGSHAHNGKRLDVYCVIQT